MQVGLTAMRRFLQFRSLLKTWSVPLACLGLGVVFGSSQAIIACEFTGNERQAAAWTNSDLVNEGVDVCIDVADLIVADLDEDDVIGVDDLLLR